MDKTVTWRCSCGALEARIRLGDGTRITCFCRFCRASARMLNHPEMLDASGGSDLYQTTPDRIEIASGAERLAAIRISSKGPLRWYASCCGTPFANTLATRAVPFASISVPPMEPKEALPDRMGVVFAEQADPAIESRNMSGLALGLGLAGRSLKAWAAGKHRLTPFFDAEGRPVAEPRRPTDAEKAKGFVSHA